MPVETAVLVLNQNYEPLNVCNTRRAIVLLDRGKAEVLEHGLGVIRTPSLTLLRPSVIRLVYMIRKPRPQLKLTRREIFIRDNYTCQYCGTRTKDLTLDHVIPRQKGGTHSWENLVSACKVCNHRKGSRTLQDSRMRLLRLPRQPKATTYHLFYQHLQEYVEWQKFVPEWEMVHS